MTRLAAFVITFRRTETVTATIGELLRQTRPPDHVLVLDNEASQRTEEAVRAMEDARLAYHAMPENVGPAGAAACGMARLREEDYDWLLWADDDDPPKTHDTIERLLRLLQDHAAPDLAGVSAVGASWNWGRGETVRLSDEELTGACEIDVAGGGQSLIVRASILGEDRLPEPRLFFGLEEFDFCLRLRRDGFRLLVEGELMREYRRQAGRLGITVRRRVGRKVPDSDLWRRYYTTRNYIFMMRRTFRRTDLALRETAKCLLRSGLAWLNGPSYGKRFTETQLAAVSDGFRERMGRTVEPPGPQTTERST